MTTEQWIGIEEAAKKYQVSIKRINTWCKRHEITHSCIDNYLIIDENSLLESIERNQQLCLMEKEFEQRKEKLIRSNEEELFILQSFKELAPLTRLIIKELAGMIKDENRRRMFLFVTLEGDLRKYAKESCQDYYYIQRQFKLLTREIQARVGFLRTYKEDMIKLKAILRLYEKNFGKNLFNTELMQERSALAQERKKALELLNTPICNLGFNTRSENVLTQNGLNTLQDILKHTYKFGWDKLTRLPDFGPTLQIRVIARLKQLDILNKEGECFLYKYLDE